MILHGSAALACGGTDLAGTISAVDPERLPVQTLGYLKRVEEAVEKAVEFTVFEHNGPELWARVRETVNDFLQGEFASGHLQGTRPEQAFFVRCDRTTMTQDDLDNGRLVCLVGLAVVKPAEFVIFRIGQKTASHCS